MNYRTKSNDYKVLDTIGKYLYIIWVISFFLWVAVYSFSADGLSPHIRRQGDVLMWLSALLSVAALIASNQMKVKGADIYRVCVVALWVFVIPVTFLLWSVGNDTARLFDNLVNLLFSIFVIPYLAGLAAFILISRLYKGGHN
jgi:hypothetical protein